jgi:RHS repeat-associated protein
MRTTYNGGVEGSYQSLPFGDGQATTGADTDANHYATLDHDTETATDHAQFRQYSNTQGRWLSPDPYSGSYDASNPQSMNRYVYVMNSPQAAVDPSGMVAPPGGGRTPSATVCVSIDGGGVCTMIQETNGGIGNGQPGDVIFLGSGSTYSDGKNTYTLTTAGWIDQDGVLLTQATANEVGLPSSINDFSWYLNGFTPYASYQVAQNNAPMANPKAVYAKYAAKPVGPTTPSTSLTPRPMPTTEIPKSALQVALELLEDTLSGLANGSLRGTIPVVVIPPAFNPYSCGKNNPQCII